MERLKSIEQCLESIALACITQPVMENPVHFYGECKWNSFGEWKTANAKSILFSLHKMMHDYPSCARWLHQEGVTEEIHEVAMGRLCNCLFDVLPVFCAMKDSMAQSLLEEFWWPIVFRISRELYQQEVEQILIPCIARSVIGFLYRDNLFGFSFEFQNSLLLP